MKCDCDSDMIEEIEQDSIIYNRCNECGSLEKICTVKERADLLAKYGLAPARKARKKTVEEIKDELWGL